MFNRMIVGAIVLFLAAASLPAADENPIVKLVKGKVKDPSKPFALAIVFKAKEGEGKAFEAALAPALTATRKEPGCVAYYLHRDTDSDVQYVMYEHFKSLAALEEHAKQLYVVKLLAEILPLLDGGPQVKVYAIVE